MNRLGFLEAVAARAIRPPVLKDISKCIPLGTPSDIVEDDDLSEALRGNPQDRPKGLALKD
ncbi:MAG TPA: hypothetical protein V6C71_26775 [Coleofasciculaceae cyanobacterium]